MLTFQFGVNVLLVKVIGLTLIELIKCQDRLWNVS